MRTRDYLGATFLHVPEHFVSTLASDVVRNVRSRDSSHHRIGASNRSRNHRGRSRRRFCKGYTEVRADGRGDSEKEVN